SIRFLEDRQPVLLGVLGLAGIVDRMTVPNDGGAGTHLSRRLRFDRLGAVSGDPGNALRTIYGWGDPAFDGRDLLRRIADLARGLGIPVSYDETAASPALEAFLATLAPIAGPPPRGLAVTLRQDLPGVSKISLDLTPRVRLDIQLDAALGGGLSIELRPPQDVSAHPSAAVQGRAQV